VASIHDEPLKVTIRRLGFDEPSQMSSWLNHYGLPEWSTRLGDEVTDSHTKLYLWFNTNERYLAIMFKLTWGQ
jgi:hypothetical protein